MLLLHLDEGHEVRSPLYLSCISRARLTTLALHTGDTPGHTPFATSHADTPTYFGQTPDSRYTPRLPSRSTPAPAPPRIDPNISLDTFQARYTSEDNSSFAVLLAKDNQTRREKHAWAWQAEEKAKQKAIRGREARERLVDVTQKMVEGSKDGIVRLLEGPAGRPGERRLVVEGVEGVSVGERESRLMVEGKREGVLLLTNGGGEGRISKEEMGKGKGKQVMTLTDGKERQFVDWDKATVEEDEDNRLPKVGDMQVPIDTWSFKVRSAPSTHLVFSSLTLFFGSFAEPQLVHVSSRRRCRSRFRSPWSAFASRCRCRQERSATSRRTKRSTLPCDEVGANRTTCKGTWCS